MTRFRRQGTRAVQATTALTVAIACAASAVRADPIEARWLAPVDGLWSDATKWSTNPTFPLNDSPAAGDAYDVVIDAAGQPYVVELSTSGANAWPFDAAVRSLTLDTSDGVLRMITGTNLTATEGIHLNNSRMEIAGTEFMTVHDTAITGGSDAAIYVMKNPRLEYFGINRSRFQNVVLGVDVIVDDTASVQFAERVTLDHVSLLLSNEFASPDAEAGVPGGDNTFLYASGTIDGHGEIILDGYNYHYGVSGVQTPARTMGIRTFLGQPLTIGPGVTIRSSVARGTIRATLGSNVVLHNEGHLMTQDDPRLSGFFTPSLSITADWFSNTGTIEAIESPLEVTTGHPWVNDGVIEFTFSSTADPVTGTLWWVLLDLSDSTLGPPRYFENGPTGTIRGAGWMYITSRYDGFYNHGVIEPIGEMLLIETRNMVTLTESSTVRINVAGTQPGEFGRLVIEGVVPTLGGTLDIALDPDFVPTLGDTFEEVVGPSTSGAFSAYTNMLVPGTDLALVPVRQAGGSYDLVTHYAGDANFDGIVNILDLTALADHWQMAGDWQAGDFTGDMFVDGADVWVLRDRWLLNAPDEPQSFADALASVGLAGIPEPGSAAVLLALGGALALRRGRR